MASRSKATGFWVAVAFLGTLGAVGLIVFGAVSVLTGVLDQRGADRIYHVQFGHPGARCRSSDTIGFDVNDGEALLCSPWPNTIGGVHGFGFSDAQDTEITELATRLGPDGLSAAEQRQIQQRVDQLVASLRPSQRPGHGAVFWGARQAWIGGGLVLGSLSACCCCGGRSSGPGPECRPGPAERVPHARDRALGGVQARPFGAGFGRPRRMPLGEQGGGPLAAPPPG